MVPKVRSTGVMTLRAMTEPGCSQLVIPDERKRLDMRVLLFCLLLCCLGASDLRAADLPPAMIKPDRLKKYLPPNWRLDGISQVDAPSAWKTRRGGRGVRVSFSNPAVTIHDAMVGDYHPFYEFTLMPPDWEGENELGAIFKGGEIVVHMTHPERQIYPDCFRARYRDYYVFDSYLGNGDWLHPFEDLRKYFEEGQKPPAGGGS